MADNKRTKNKVNVVGILSENKLQLRQGNRGEFIFGSLIIEVEPDNLVEVRISCSSTKSDGSPIAAFNSLKNKMSTVKSIVSVGREIADTVEVMASFEDNSFYGRDGNLVEFMTPRAMNFNVVSKTEPHRATFEVDAFFTHSNNEIDNDVPTGRLVLNCGLFAYDTSLNPIKFIMPQGPGIAYAQSFQPNSSLYLKGDIKTTIKKTVVSEGEGWNGTIEKVYENKRTEYILNNGNVKQDPSTCFTLEEAQAGKIKREQNLINAKERADAKASSTPAQNTGVNVGFNFNNGGSNVTGLPKDFLGL